MTDLSHPEQTPNRIKPRAFGASSGRSVDEAWFTTKRPLTNTQRLTFLLMSGLMGTAGCALLRIGLADFSETNSLTGLITSMFGLCAVLLALRGIWRVWWDIFRRNRSKSNEPNPPEFSSTHYITAEHSAAVPHSNHQTSKRN